MDNINEEIWIEQNKLYFSMDNILYVTIVGEPELDIALKIKEITYKIYNTSDKKVDVLVDLNEAGKGPPAVRKIWKQLSEHKNVGKIAQIGLHPVARMLAKYSLAMSKNNNIQFFKTKEEALKWLKN